MKILNKKATSMIEFAALFIIIIGAFVVMRNYMQRGLFGTWGQAGQSFAYGRQYDSQKTIDCAYDPQSAAWYDYNCFQSKAKKCDGAAACEESIINSGTCSDSSCGELNNGSDI